jgi:predicted DNA-binding transcriptional regulator AlpA
MNPSARPDRTKPPSKEASPRAEEFELRPLLGVEEVSQLLGIPKATLYRWHSLSTLDAPQGPRAFRMGRYLRYTLEDVRSYIEQLRMQSA